MTRFWITLPEAVEFVLSSLPLVEGGETFVPKIPSARVVDIAEALAPGAERVITGIRPGEKIHETLLTEDEARNAYDLGDRFFIRAFGPAPARPRGEPLREAFAYSSGANPEWLDVDALRRVLGAVPLAA